MVDDDHLEEDPEWTSWLWTFENQTILGHALLVFGGVAVWIGVYAVWLEIIFGGFELAVANSSEAILARRSAIRAASIVGWSWFALGFIWGKGGPMLNFCYALSLTYVGPTLLTYFAFDSAPHHLFAADRAISGGFVCAVLYVLLPGMLIGFGLLFASLFIVYFVTGTGREWERKHMPEDFREYE